MGAAGVEMMREQIQRGIRESSHMPAKERLPFIHSTNVFPKYGQPWRVYKAMLRAELVAAGLLNEGDRLAASLIKEDPALLFTTAPAIGSNTNKESSHV